MNGSRQPAGDSAAREVGAQSPQSRVLTAGIVAVEGGGTAPHPMGGGVAKSRRRETIGGLR